MGGNKLTTLNTGKYREIITYPTFSILTKALGNQIVGWVKFLFIAVFHLIKEDGLLELNYHHFSTLKKPKFLDFDHQWLLSSKKGASHNNNYELVL